MTRRPPISALCLFFLVTACGPEKSGVLVRPYIPAPTMTPDVGVDMSGDVGAPDPDCVGRNDGAQCALENASGTCVQGECQFLACLSGFADCDDTLGCERDVQTQTSCGACDRTCREGQVCQLSGRGFLCSAGVVCPSGVFDLDQERDNGCEWSIGASSSGPTQPAGLFDVQAVEIDAEFGVALAGRGEMGRYVRDASTVGEVEPLALDGTPLEAADASSVSMGQGIDGERAALVGWERDVTLERETPGGRVLEVYDAACHEQPVRDVAWTGQGRWVQALDRGVAAISSGEEAATFGQVEYVRAFFPFPGAVDGAASERWRFGGSEVTSCTPCVFSAQTGAQAEDSRCAGVTQCQDEGFDASVCVTCAQAEGECPEFRPVRVVGSRWEDVTYVLTRRGLVMMSRGGGDWSALARAESAFVPGQVSGAQFVAAAVASMGDGERVFLLHSTGFVRALDVTRGQDVAVSIVPGGADVGLTVEPGEAVSVTALDADTLAVTSGRLAYVVGWRARSARTFQLPIEGGGSRGDGFVRARARVDGFSFARVQFGNVVTQDVTR